MIELEHSPLGGSAAHRFMTCAGSFLEQRRQIEAGEFVNIESEYAKLGTGAHLLGAVALASDREPFEFLGEEFNGYLAGWSDGIDLDAVSVYVNHCREIMERCNHDGLAIVEKTYHLPETHPLLRGTVDFGYVSPKYGLFLRDYKNGEGIGVSACNNRQLLYYAFLMIMADPVLPLTDPNFPVSLGIVQPNFYGVFEEPDVWETTLGFVLDWGHKQLLPRMIDLYEGFQHWTEPHGDVIEDDFVPGDHCQFCPVLIDCPKMKAAFEEYADASEDFVTMLKDEELDVLYAKREYARRFMNVLETTVHARLIGGGSIPSAKLVEKRVARVWKPGAAAVLEATFGDKAYEPKKIKSPAGIEKLSSRGKDLALEYGYKPDSAGLSVAPQSDPRPEAKPRGNATVFEGHAQSPAEAGW